MDAILSPRRRLVLAAFGAAALVSACGERRSASSTTQLHFSGQTMGTSYSVRLAGGPFEAGLEEAAQRAVGKAFDRVVSRMSTFEAASELQRFNRHAATTPFALSADTLAVLERAQEVSALSGGAFDITVDPLVAAWGFGAGAGNRGLPSLDERRAATVGWQRLSIDPAAGTASKSDAALQADLSGIAKGYAVDLAAQALEALGLQRYMVEAGGELRTRGLNSAGRPWQIAVEQPDAWPQRARQIVPLQGLAMATSGDYRNFYELQGRRYCHEIDPASREPISNGLASVTVVAPECAYADAMATALIVLGPERGLALAQRLGLPTLFIVREAAGGLRDLATPAFAALGARAVA